MNKLQKQIQGKACSCSVHAQSNPDTCTLASYHTWENFVREKMANHELFAKIFLTNIIFTDTRKTYTAYALTVAYLPNFSSPIAFTCMVRQNFPLPNISHAQ